jgi:hypothetical protein
VSLVPEITFAGPSATRPVIRVVMIAGKAGKALASGS